MGEGTALPWAIQPCRRVPSAAVTVNGVACAGRCAVELAGCGKKIRLSCISHAAAGTPMAIATTAIQPVHAGVRRWVRFVSGGL